jgi:hypothetical protein
MQPDANNIEHLIQLKITEIRICEECIQGYTIGKPRNSPHVNRLHTELTALYAERTRFQKRRF